MQYLIKWKNYEQILEQTELYVYPRKDASENELMKHPKVKLITAPMMEISSSFIRDAIKAKKNVQYMVPEKVWDFLEEMNFYK